MVRNIKEGVKDTINIGFININGTNMTSWPDMEEELNLHEIEIVGIVETHIRNRAKWEGKYYKLIGKGRDIKKKRGGGIAFMIKKRQDWEIEEVALEENENTEDILACQI